MGPNGRPKIAVLYHYFHPDDVVSARHLTQFCEALQERGWQVEALPCNRGCRDDSVSYPLREDWKGLTIRRVWRPRLRQASGVGRVLNALWMLTSWCRLALRSRRKAPDVVLIGTDPVLSVLVALVLRKLRPRIRLAHWCFDLYPEIAIAEGLMTSGGWLARALRPLLRAAYGSCDLIADLGSLYASPAGIVPPCRPQSDAGSLGLGRAGPFGSARPGDSPRVVRRSASGTAVLGQLRAGPFFQRFSGTGPAAARRRSPLLLRCPRQSGRGVACGPAGRRHEH